MQMNKIAIKKGAALALTFIISALLVGGGLLSAIPSNINIFSDETKIINLPLKDVTISVLPERVVIPGGHSIGVRMDVKVLWLAWKNQTPSGEESILD